MTQARTFTTTYHRDFHPGARFHWRLQIYGAGHWCVGAGFAGTFATQADAEASGRVWVITGLPPFEQTPDRLAPWLVRPLEDLARVSGAEMTRERIAA